MRIKLDSMCKMLRTVLTTWQTINFCYHYHQQFKIILLTSKTLILLLVIVETVSLRTEKLYDTVISYLLYNWISKIQRYKLV